MAEKQRMSLFCSYVKRRVKILKKKRKILKADLIYNEIMKADKKRRDQQTRNRNKKGQHRGKKEEI